ncbi:hypothetical protein D0T84_11505 [Dysgonomonas sp. 521]|uniref:hypothetical protein n=1 Tax=Dysgonomonas sp. 521 TaxID=2302932 RepID=UPI0013D707F8|nr:hypothetical protein [Dysgonomonas sp. 521]NDV95531.1 hypothetical protein [Dysgonomonas sp. 521]
MGNTRDENILIFENNLPSRRWKIRRIRTAADKKLRRTDKECTQVYNQIRNLGYEDLDPPIQRGYIRLFTLTEETKYNKCADFYQELLDKINTIRYSPHKTFKEKKRRIGKWKYKIRNEQTLQELDEWTFLNSKRITDEEKELFHPVEYYDTYMKKYRTKYIFIEPWRFVLRVRPNMITQVKIKDSELEKYESELSDYLDRHKNRGRIYKMKSRKYSWKKVLNEKEDKKRYRYSSFVNVSFHVVENEYREEKDLLWTTI